VGSIGYRRTKIRLWVALSLGYLVMGEDKGTGLTCGSLANRLVTEN